MWLRPEAPAESSTLLSLGPLKLMRVLDQVEARIDSEKIAAAALPGSAWSHVALTVVGGKAVLYINGKPAGQADVLLPNSMLVLGNKGLIA